MEYRILGPLEVSAAGRSLRLGGQRQRRILAALLLGVGRPVPLSQLVEAGWDDDPPASAAHQARNRVAELRRLLTPVGGFIDTEGDGYRLRIGAGELDAAVFDELARRGRADRDPALLRRALGLWRGPALAGVGGGWIGRHADRLDEQRLAASEECFELELAAGDGAGLVDELGALVTAHPLRERLVGLWMTALHRCGRRAEALSAYRSLASRLADELGIDPSPELRRRHDEISRDDGGAPHAVPAQLPRDVPGFVGRMGDLAALDGLLSDSQAGRTVVISAIAGTAGVGKTALAVHWAHRVRDKFPDGQLYVDLRGFDPSGTVKSPAEALRGFLDALRVPAQRVPADLDGQAALYRSALADKRMLVLLDNARDADQVRPLLPDAPECLVVVASRNRLTGLTAEGAHPILLDLLPVAEAEQLLARRLGAERVAAEPDAVDRIITRCARLPLALAIVAARAADVDVALATLADELDQAPGDLGSFAADDPRADVRAVFSWSHRALSGAAARLFRLLGLHAGPDFAAPAAASLVGQPVERVEALLAELTRAHLITEHAPGRFALQTCCGRTRALRPTPSTAPRNAAPRCTGCSATTCTVRAQPPASSPRTVIRIRPRNTHPAPPSTISPIMAKRSPGTPPSTRHWSPRSARPPTRARTRSRGGWPGRCPRTSAARANGTTGSPPRPSPSPPPGGWVTGGCRRVASTASAASTSGPGGPSRRRATSGRPWTCTARSATAPGRLTSTGISPSPPACAATSTRRSATPRRRSSCTAPPGTGSVRPGH
jgi:DNA-binding SARP family transcriptional activator